ncbi:MAG: response regulator [Spirochaetales bacterium]|nr:response regulator [Spirochaetales bacterium]
MNNKILLVDDSAQIVRTFKQILQTAGYNVETASDGIEALAIMHEFKPDVLIVDMIMPKLQGDKLCKLIRTREGYKDLFIIVISAIAAERKIDVKSFGGDVCIAKGPVGNMQTLILDLLEKKARDSSFQPPENVLGLEGVYRRSITSELLAGRYHADVVLNNISDGIVELTGEEEILFANPRAACFLGRPEEELLATKFSSWFEPRDQEELRKHLALLPREKREEPQDLDVTLGDKTLVVNLVYLEDEFGPRIIVLMKDISGYKRVEKELTDALKDKDILLKEIHHRVKNNLAMVAGIVSLELDNVVCEADVKIMRALRSRIESISLVHDKLYKSTDMSCLNLNEFIHDLVDNILALSTEELHPLLFVSDVPDIFVNVDTAIPLALIISELVTNSVKYAFPKGSASWGEEGGIIRIRFYRDMGNQMSLEVRDNGKGFDENFLGSSGDTLGWKLIESLTAQLGGKVGYRNDKGALVSIKLPEEDFLGN